MKNLFRRITSSITALAMTMSLTGGVQLVSFAEEAMGYSEVSIDTFVSNEVISGDEALEGYINQQLMGASGISVFNYRTNAATTLNELEYSTYETLAAFVKSVAAGETIYTEKQIALNSMTYSELGLDASADVTAMTAALQNKLNIDKINNQLLADFPYDMYWYDKTPTGGLDTLVQMSYVSGDYINYTLTPGDIVNFKQLCAVCGYGYISADDESVKGQGAGYRYPIHTENKATVPQIKGENGKTGWNVISDELVLAHGGDTVTVDMNGTTKMPKAILEDIEGRNIDLVLDMGSGITWTINGETVTNPKTVDMRVSKNVKRIPIDIIDNVTGDNFSMEISLAHNGKFGFEAMLTISLGRKYNDNYANLYYYNPSNKEMEFIDSDLIANGNAQLIFNHASDYAIVIDEEALGDDVSSASGVTADSEEMESEATVSVVFALPLVLAAGFVIRKKLCK